MIIFGFRTYIRSLAVVTYVCNRCHYTTAHRIAERVRKFTLFFIPLFPLSTSRVATCTYCGQATLMSNPVSVPQPAQQNYAGAATA